MVAEFKLRRQQPQPAAAHAAMVAEFKHVDSNSNPTAHAAMVAEFKHVDSNSKSPTAYAAAAGWALNSATIAARAGGRALNSANHRRAGARALNSATIAAFEFGNHGRGARPAVGRRRARYVS